VSKRRFVHLNVHSEYSIVDSVVRIDRMVEAAAAAGMPAIALTDQCNLFAAVKFQKAALAHGVQPIFGARTRVIENMGFPGYFLIVADFIRWARTTAYRWDRAAAPARARWWLGRWGLPTSIRSATTCCSSAS
jgi:DNA polymerase III alpha subunit